MSLTIDNLHLDIQYHHRPKKAAALEQELQSLVLASFEQLTLAHQGKAGQEAAEPLLLPDIHIDLREIDFSHFMRQPMDYFNRVIFPRIEQAFQVSLAQAEKEKLAGRQGDETSVVTATDIDLQGRWQEIKAALLYGRGAFFDFRQQQPKAALFTLLLRCLQAQSGYQQTLKSWLLVPKVRQHLFKLLAQQDFVTQADTLLQNLFPSACREQHLTYFQYPDLSATTKKQMWQSYLGGLLSFESTMDEDKQTQLTLILQSFTLEFIGGQSSREKIGQHFNQSLVALRQTLAQPVEKRLLAALITWMNIGQYQGVSESGLSGLEGLLGKTAAMPLAVSNSGIDNFARVIDDLTSLFKLLNELYIFSGSQQQLALQLEKLSLWLKGAKDLPLDIRAKIREKLTFLADDSRDDNWIEVDFHQLAKRLEYISGKSFALQGEEISWVINQVLQMPGLPESLYGRLNECRLQLLGGQRQQLLPDLAGDLQNWCLYAHKLRANQGVSTAKGTLSDKAWNNWQAVLLLLASADFSGPDDTLSAQDKTRLQPVLLALVLLQTSLSKNLQLFIGTFLQQLSKGAFNRLKSAFAAEKKHLVSVSGELTASSTELAAFHALYQVESGVAAEITTCLASLIQSLDEQSEDLDNDFEILSLFLGHFKSLSQQQSAYNTYGEQLYQLLTGLLAFIYHKQQLLGAGIEHWRQLEANVRQQLAKLTISGSDKARLNWWRPIVTSGAEQNLTLTALRQGLNISYKAINQDYGPYLDAENADSPEQVNSPELALSYPVFIRQQAQLLTSIIALPQSTWQQNPSDATAIITWCEHSLRVLAAIGKSISPGQEQGAEILGQQQTLAHFLQQTRQQIKTLLSQPKPGQDSDNPDKTLADSLADNLADSLADNIDVLTRLSQVDLARVLLNEANGQDIQGQLQPFAPYHPGIALSLDNLADNKLISLKALDLAKVKPFVRQLKQKIADVSEQQAEQHQQMLSCDGGLLLLWPYLNTFFNKFNLLQTNEAGETAFVDDRARLKAHALLVHMLAKPASESVYVVANLLCGLEPETLVTTEVALTQDDKTACEQLLQAIIHHWQALKAMPVASFREMFLLRETLCCVSELGYTLTVENKAQDVLMTKLPWGLGMVNLPWRGKQLLQVQWSYGL